MTGLAVLQEALIFKGEDNPALLKQIEALRLAVWSDLTTVSVARKRFGLDQLDDRAWHVVHFDENTIIAAGRLIIAESRSGVPDLCSLNPYLDLMEFPVGVMNRLFVNRTHRGKGIAQGIIRERIKLAHELGVFDLWVEARSAAAPSLEQHGFCDIGPSADTSITGEWRIFRRHN